MPPRRHLIYALEPGTPLWRSVRLTMHGEIKLGAWRRFRATEVLSPPEELVWHATVRIPGLPIIGSDRYLNGAGSMRWRLFRMIPVVAAAGHDVTRSAAGRLAGEAVTLLPTAFQRVRWSAGPDTGRCVAIWDVGNEEVRVEMLVDAAGRLRQVSMQRWGNPNGGPFGRHQFVVDIDGDDSGEFFRATITGAEFFMPTR